MAASDWTIDCSNSHFASRVMFFCTALHSHFILVPNGKETIDNFIEELRIFESSSQIFLFDNVNVLILTTTLGTLRDN